MGKITVNLWLNRFVYVARLVDVARCWEIHGELIWIHGVLQLLASHGYWNIDMKVS